MYGWRARIGHVAPSRGDTLVYEFYKMFPEGFMMLNTTGTVRQLVDNDSRSSCSALRRRCRIWWITIATRSSLAAHPFSPGFLSAQIAKWGGS